MTHELNRVTQVLLVGLILIAAAAVFWGVLRADGLLAREDNARNVIRAQRLARGSIFDRNDELLVFSQEDDTGVMQRVYRYPETVGTVGYYSFTYGTAGIEAAFDEWLTGERQRDDWQAFVDDLLHRDQVGYDVRATVDMAVQEALFEAMRGRSGAAVAVEVPSGRVLAMVSLPGYDPNAIDDNWDALAEDEFTSPLLNRVTAGLYQPGGALHTVTLAAILGTYSELTTGGLMALSAEAPDARAPVSIPASDAQRGLTLICLADAPSEPLTLAEAYVFGCPAPFAAALKGRVSPEHLWERWRVLGLLEPPALAGFETEAGDAPEPLGPDSSPERLTAAAVGQGGLTVTPLQMAQVVVAIANGGKGVPLHLVDAVRAPGAAEWETVDVPARQPALLRADVAEAVRLAMLQAAAQSPSVQQARRGDLVLYGHSATAFAGPDATPYAWFNGFVDQSVGDRAAALVVVVVIEDEDDPGVAAHVAGEAFAAAAGFAD